MRDFLEPCKCGEYGGRQHVIRLGEYPFSKTIKIARCTHLVEGIRWGKGLETFPIAMLIPAALWDLLHSGLGLRQDTVHCAKCGKFDHADETSAGAEMLEHRLCHGCNFWRKRKLGVDERTVVAAGHCYWIEDDRPEGYDGFVGFGGAKWKVEFFDGRVVHTRNLWSNGDVPDVWRAEFPDNATLKNESRRSAYIGTGNAPT